MVSEKTYDKVGKAMVPIMAIYALGASQGGVNAGMATFAVAFPDAGANIAYVVSMVALGMIPSGIISGVVTGKYIKYRTSIITAIVLYLVSGLYPMVMPAEGASWTMLLVSRFVFGFAVGWSYPLAQALVFKTIADERKRASWLGIGMAFFNLGSMIMEFAGGYLALVGWKYVFLVYLVGIIPLVIVALMLKEPKTDAQQALERAEEHHSEVSKAKIPPIAFVYMVMLWLTCAFAMPTILYCSFVVPNPVVAGWILSAMTLVGVLTGFTLGPVYKRIGKWTLPVGAIFLGVFYIAAALVSDPESFNLPLYAAAFLVGHWGFAIIIPGTADMVTNLTPIGAATRAMGFNTALHQMGCFTATPFAALLLTAVGGTAVTDVLLPSAIIVLVLGVVLAVITALTKVEKYGENYGK